MLASAKMLEQQRDVFAPAQRGKASVATFSEQAQLLLLPAA
ncbi:hypothetical protein ACVBEH_12770 [Roseateles sp. GG27B]